MAESLQNFIELATSKGNFDTPLGINESNMSSGTKSVTPLSATDTSLPGSSGLSDHKRKSRDGKKIDKRKRGESSHSKRERLDSTPQVDLGKIKDQLNQLMQIVPVVQELKQAYDEFNKDSPQHSSDVDEELLDTSPPATPSTVDSISYFKGVLGSSQVEGPVINDDIATGATSILCSGLPSEAQDKLAGKYATPGNCPRMAVVPCNKEIYRTVSKTIKMKDSALQNIQKCLLKGLSAVTYTFDHIARISAQPEVSKDDLKTIATSSADAIALLANTSHMVDIHRRVTFRPDIKEEYASLCSDTYPVQDFLFGSELPEKIKDVAETNKVSQRVNKRFQPYPVPHGSQGFRKQFPFLGHRHDSWKRGRGTPNKWKTRSYQTGHSQSQGSRPEKHQKPTQRKRQ